MVCLKSIGKFLVIELLFISVSYGCSNDNSELNQEPVIDEKIFRTKELINIKPI